MKVADLPQQMIADVRHGVVIPAMPLALTQDRRLDTAHQKALVRYYVDSGAGGIAVGVHTTQFAIRDPGVDLYGPVLSLVSETIDTWCAYRGRTILKVAGVCGKTDQARQEAAIARDAGYHAALLSLGSLTQEAVSSPVRGEGISLAIEHCRAIAAVLPLVGFYLQPAVGGVYLPYSFWRSFAEIENVLAIKIAPFNRYQTLDVVRAICEAGRAGEIALYTGNDDAIIVDLLTPYAFETNRGPVSARLVGGLLGQWAVWTKRAVDLLHEIQTLREGGGAAPASMLTLAAQLTDANGAIFDAANRFAGCIPGIHYVLQRQGLFAGTWCLNPDEVLSPGQAREINRVSAAYPWLTDDAFVEQNRAIWLESD